MSDSLTLLGVCSTREIVGYYYYIILYISVIIIIIAATITSRIQLAALIPGKIVWGANEINKGIIRWSILTAGNYAAY